MFVKFTTRIDYDGENLSYYSIYNSQSFCYGQSFSLKNAYSTSVGKTKIGNHSYCLSKLYYYERVLHCKRTSSSDLKNCNIWISFCRSINYTLYEIKDILL
jgi:hypothetical protein